MPVFELKTEIRPDLAGPMEEFLAEQEEQRIMVIEDKPEGRAWLVGYFASQSEGEEAWKVLPPMRNQAGVAAFPAVREMPDVDWKNSYKAHFKASKFGRLNWVPVWERDTFSLPAGEEVLWLDPGMAFGTGNHETTRLCCERLAQLSLTHSAADQVIDAGCGSGILALSAARLGFQQILGFDVDSEAIRVSEENARLNDLTGAVRFLVGDLVTGLNQQKAGIILANIQADVLMKFAPDLISALAPGGTLVLSGILTPELERVRTIYNGLLPGSTSDSRSLGEWSDLCLHTVS